MRLDIPEDDPRRISVRSWLREHVQPSGRELAEAGYVAPHWPKPWGLDADPIHQLIIDDELARAHVRRPTNPIGIGWAGPTILHARYFRAQVAVFAAATFRRSIGANYFLNRKRQYLAGLTTRAVRDGDEWVVNGQKVWTSGAQHAEFILIARTDVNVSKHKGITYFICPMNSAGIEVRPIREMTVDKRSMKCSSPICASHMPML